MMIYMVAGENVVVVIMVAEHHFRGLLVQISTVGWTTDGRSVEMILALFHNCARLSGRIRIQSAVSCVESSSLDVSPMEFVPALSKNSI